MVIKFIWNNLRFHYAISERNKLKRKATKTNNFQKVKGKKEDSAGDRVVRVRTKHCNCQQREYNYDWSQGTRNGECIKHSSL